MAAFSLVLAGWTAPALAQGPNTSVSTALTDISVVDISPAETRVVLSFAGHVPKFLVTTSESDHPTVVFVFTSRGPVARAPAGGRGLVRTIDFEQHGYSLSLRLTASTRVVMTAVADGEHTVVLTLKTPTAAATATATAAVNGPLPAASDRPPGEDGFEVVLLKYADVSEVVGLLTEGQTVKANDAFTPREPAFGAVGINGGQYNPPLPVSPDAFNQPLGQSVDASIGIDRRLNAIILKGSPEHIARLKDKIARIDVPVESVILETMFVELDESGATNVGLDFNNANSQIAVATFQAGSFIPPGFAQNRNLRSISLQAAIYAQVQAGRGRIVSRPRIAAQSGAEAKIITGDALPILTSITLSGVNGVSQQVQYVNVGVTLQIAPRVTNDGFVTSHVFGVVSSVTGYSQGYPTISQREAETSATVKDGETFVIGGLTQENELSTNSKVPVVGDIPLAGELFHLRKGTRSKTQLYIVVTPHIVHRGEALPADLTAPASPPR